MRALTRRLPIDMGPEQGRRRTFRRRARATAGRRMPLAILVAVLLALGGPLAARAQPGAATPGATPLPGSVDYEVPVAGGGRSLHLNCLGTGSPTVVLEAGGPGDDSTEWLPLQADVATFARAC